MSYKKLKTKRNPSRIRRLTPEEKEDARDAAIIRMESRKPTYSFRAFLKEMGYKIQREQV